MSNIIRAFLCDEDEVLTTEAAFIGFQALARSRGIRYRTVPYREWRYDLHALAAAINERTKIVYLANPEQSRPARSSRRSQFDEFYRHVPERVLIILDEAYFEYAQGPAGLPRFDALPLRQRHYPADVFEGLRPGGGAHRLWLRARGTDPQPAQGETAVRALDARAGGRHCRAGRPRVPAPHAGTECPRNRAT